MLLNYPQLSRLLHVNLNISLRFNRRLRIFIFCFLILYHIKVSEGKFEDYSSHNIIEPTTYIFASPVDNSSLANESFVIQQTQHTRGHEEDLYSQPSSNLVMTSVPYDHDGIANSYGSSSNNNQYYYGSGSGSNYYPNFDSKSYYKSPGYSPSSSDTHYPGNFKYKQGKGSKHHTGNSMDSKYYPWRVKKKRQQRQDSDSDSDFPLSHPPNFASNFDRSKSKSRSKFTGSAGSKKKSRRRQISSKMKSKLRSKSKYGKYNKNHKNYYLNDVGGMGGKKGKKYLQNKNDGWFNDFPEFKYPFDEADGSIEDEDEDDSEENFLESGLSSLLDYPDTDFDLFGDGDDFDLENDDDLSFGELDDAVGEETFVRPTIVDFHNGINLAAAGFSGLNELGGLSRFAGTGLTRAFFPFRGVRSFMKNGFRLFIALILLPFILLFIPIPIVSSTTSSNSRNTFGGASTDEFGHDMYNTSSTHTSSTNQFAEFGRRVLSSENCLERISCEINHFNEVTGMEDSENQMFSRFMSFVHDFETFFPHFLVRMATGYVNDSHFDSCSRFLCQNLKSHLTI